LTDFESFKQWVKEYKSFIKYSIVGVSGTFVDVAVLFVLIEYCALPLLVATTISFIASVINNFVWNKIWTFRSTSSNYRKLFIKFLLVACGGLILTNASMLLLVEILGVYYIYGKLGLFYDYKTVRV